MPTHFRRYSSKFADKLEKIAAELRETGNIFVKVRLVGELAKAGLRRRCSASHT